MTKEDWLQICRLNHAWYLIEVFHNRNLNEVTPDVLDDYLDRVSNETFEDGRIEFFQKYFKQDINEEQINKFAENYTQEFTGVSSSVSDFAADIYKSFKAGCYKILE